MSEKTYLSAEPCPASDPAADAAWMKEALRLAAEAGEAGEVPVGAVIVCDGKMVGWGKNGRETQKNALRHAEIDAIDMACRTLGGWRLHRCDLYVTLEPCPMCAGAIMNARLRRVVYGAADPKAGAYGSVMDLNAFPVNHKPCLTAGVEAERASDLLGEFFRRLREKEKSKKEK